MCTSYYLKHIFHRKITTYYDIVCFFIDNTVILPQNHIIMTSEEIGKQIKKRRKVLRITQPDLAEMAGISINTLYKIERGQANPTIQIVNKITEILGMEIKIEVKQPQL